MIYPSSPQRRLFLEGDEDIRHLQRRAAQGDPEAQAALARSQNRSSPRIRVTRGGGFNSWTGGARYIGDPTAHGNYRQIYIGNINMDSYDAMKLLDHFGMVEGRANYTDLPNNYSFYYVMDVLLPDGRVISINWGGDTYIRTSHQESAEVCDIVTEWSRNPPNELVVVGLTRRNESLSERQGH